MSYVEKKLAEEAERERKMAAAFQHIRNPKERRLALLVAEREKTRQFEGAEGFKREQDKKIKDIVTGLLDESSKAEDQVLVDENEVFFRNEDNFFKGQDIIELDNLKSRQQQEAKDIKALHEQRVGQVKKRAAATKFEREQLREMKSVYLTTHVQEMAYEKTHETRILLSEHRERIEEDVKFMEERHQRQIRHFQEAEERRVEDQRVLIELQSRHLAEEERAKAMKRHSSRMTHQKNVDKKRLDQLREQQRMELSHYKMRADSQIKMLENLSALQNKHVFDEQTLDQQQRATYIIEKERVLSAQDHVKYLEVQDENLTELRRLQLHHKVQVRQLRQSQKARRDKRIKHWSGIIGRDVSLARQNGSHDSSSNASKSSSVGSKSGVQSTSYTRQQSHVGTVNKNQDPINLMNSHFEDDNDDIAMNMGGIDQQAAAKEQLEQLRGHLEDLRKKHSDNLVAVQTQHQEDYKKKEEEFKKRLMELEWEQEIALKDLKQSNEVQIGEALKIQEREIAMEEHIRESESKQMQERKILNQILDGVDEAVISIDTRGRIIRFNKSAEDFWGYRADEIMGQNVKMLMTSKHSVDHDTFLYNYLTTGIKKIIGKRPEHNALRKDGTEFPVKLTVTEVVEDGVHIFNAFLLNLTSEYDAMRAREAEEACLPQMIWKINCNGDAYYFNERFIEYTGVTEGNVFDPAVVHSDDVKSSWRAFQAANMTKESFETKRRLKGKDGNYKWFITRGSPIFDDHGEIRSWCGSCTDVDVATKLQVEMESLPEALPQSLFKCDVNGDVTFANSNFMTYLGAKKTQKLNIFSPMIVHKDDISKAKKAFAKSTASQEPFEIRERYLGVNGQYKWFLTRGSPVTNQNGDVAYFFGTSTDVHEETLQQMEMAALPEALPQLVWKVDPKGNVLYANVKFMSFVGATEYEGLNVFADSVVHPDDYKASLQAFAKGTKDKSEFSLQRRLKNRHGEYVKMQTIGVPILDDEKNILGWYGTCTKQ